MEEIYRERFLKLYNHMVQPQEKLGHKYFYFGYFNNAQNVCGTIGCMGGELPVIFPNEWYFKDDDPDLIYKTAQWPLSLSDCFLSVSDCLVRFFNITYEEVRHLFYPGFQDSTIDPYFLEHLRLKSSALKEEVVENLRRFLVIKNIL